MLYNLFVKNEINQIEQYAIGPFINKNKVEYNCVNDTECQLRDTVL